MMDPPQALALAQEMGLDLVEVAPGAKPPVCRIMDHGKYLYQQSKRAQEAKRHQKTIQVKEVKFRIKISEHDYQFKKAHITRFLKEGNRVKATMIFRGREVTRQEVGRGILMRLQEELGGIADVEREPKLEGRAMTMVLSARKKSG